MDRELSDSDVIAAFRAEVAAWRPKHVPNLLELSHAGKHHWRRPVAFASAVGALALALVLVLSLLVVVVVPGSVPGIEYVKDHLATRPGP
ncbi:MAG TPA: hypothetical protein VKI99_05130 [Candidatus Dormibacteraeota bacterium]|nr:hypothetical protein [Candidatus Dormibacteraeota bacterium]